MVDVAGREYRGAGGIDRIALPWIREVRSGNREQRSGVLAGAVVGELSRIPRRLAVGAIDEKGDELKSIALNQESAPAGLEHVVVDVRVVGAPGMEGKEHKQEPNNQSFKHGGLRGVRLPLQLDGIVLPIGDLGKYVAISLRYADSVRCGRQCSGPPKVASSRQPPPAFGAE